MLKQLFDRNYGLWFLVACALAFTLQACKTPALTKRIRGTWYIDHYDEYAVRAGTGTGHDLDGAGYLKFSRSAASRSLRARRPHGALSGIDRAAWTLEDSVLRIGGANAEVWLITKDLTDYLELVSVNESRDTVRTMYLRK